MNLTECKWLPGLPESIKGSLAGDWKLDQAESIVVRADDMDLWIIVWDDGAWKVFRSGSNCHINIAKGKGGKSKAIAKAEKHMPSTPGFQLEN